MTMLLSDHSAWRSGPNRSVPAWRAVALGGGGWAGSVNLGL